jgi:hypothetical protein
LALILAINPGNVHSPTLARLGRELKGCELIGAESCAIAIRAIDERVPDLILLPASSPRGEQDLLSRLLKVPGGVPTLKLPPPAGADPLALAAEIRTLLTGSGPAPIIETAAALPATASPYVIAAATAAVQWIRRRRDSWKNERAVVDRPSSIVDRPPSFGRDRYEPIPAAAGVSPYDAELRVTDSVVTIDDHRPTADDRRSAIDDEPSTIGDDRSTIADRPALADNASAWQALAGREWPIRRIAAAAVVIGAVGGLAMFWPTIRAAFSGAAEPQSRSPVTRPVEPAPSPAPAPPPVAQVESDAGSKISGWIAVFAPFEVTVSEANGAISLDDRNRAMLPPGRHRLRFQNTAMGYEETRTVTVRSTDTTTINLNPQTSIAVNASQPAQVIIDGQPAGETPFKGQLTLGAHTVVVKGAAGERQIAVDATSKPVQIDVDFSQ